MSRPGDRLILMGSIAASMTLMASVAFAMLPAITWPKVDGHDVVRTGPGEAEVRIAEVDLPEVMMEIARTAPASCNLDDIDVKAGMRRAQALIWPGFIDPAVASGPLVLKNVIEGSHVLKSETFIPNVIGTSKITVISTKTQERLAWAGIEYSDRTILNDNLAQRQRSCNFHEYTGPLSILNSEVEANYSGRLTYIAPLNSSWWKSWSLRPSQGTGWPKHTNVTLLLGGDPSGGAAHVVLSVWAVETLSRAGQPP